MANLTPCGGNSAGPTSSEGRKRSKAEFFSDGISHFAPSFITRRNGFVVLRGSRTFASGRATLASPVSRPAKVTPPLNGLLDARDHGVCHSTLQGLTPHCCLTFIHSSELDSRPPRRRFPSLPSPSSVDTRPSDPWMRRESYRCSLEGRMNLLSLVLMRLPPPAAASPRPLRPRRASSPSLFAERSRYRLNVC
jgi:hypothetical protein